MSRLTGLLPASFKSVAFYVRSEVLTEGGRRIVLHDYPNSSERFVEDLGELPPKFTVTAFISGPNFLNLSDQLELKLKEKGAGDLVLPNFGKLKAFALPYRKDASQISVGEIRFELSFVVGKAISGPARAPVTVEKVYSTGDTARDAINNALENKWTEPTKANNALAAQYDLKQITAAVQKLNTSLKNVSSVNKIVDYIDLNTPTIVRDTITLKNAVGDLWQTVSVGLSNGAGLSDILLLTQFGSALSLSLSDIRSASTSATATSESTNIPLWNETTSARIIRNDNRLALCNHARLSALTIAYEQAADTTYSNDAQLDEVRKTLEEQHQRLMRDDTDDVDFLQSQPAVRFAIEDLRLAALEVLDQKDQTIFDLTTINANVPIPAYVLAYNLYAEEFETSDEITERTTLIRNLNPDQPSDKMVGDLMVLQT